MAESGIERLHSLLFGKVRELKNVKFCPGFNRGLTADQLSGEAASMLETAFASGELVDNPPLSGRKKASIQDAF
jgi:hypothetical protein